MKKHWLVFLLLFMFCAGSVLAAEAPTQKIVYSTKADVNGTIYIIGDKEFGPYQDLRSSSFSLDGKWALLMMKDHKFYTVVNGKEFGPYETNQDLYNITLFANGSSYFILSRDEKGQYIIINNKTLGPYQGILEKSIALSA
jgi:hypothetical protein